MDIFESLENLNVSEECFNDIIDTIKKLIGEDLETQAEKKYGPHSQKYRKAVRLGDEAADQADREGKDLSTKQDKGQEKTYDRMEKQGRLSTYLKRRVLDKLDDPDYYDYDRVAIEKAQDRHYANELRKKGVK